MTTRRAKGSIFVFTFKEGVLSSVAHDLRIRLEQFDITLDDDKIVAEFDLKALHVDGPVEHGVVRAEGYDARQRADVEKAMHRDVLHTDKHPTARFQGTASPRANGFRVSGDLALAGRSAPLSFDVGEQGGVYRAEFEFEPSRFGIAQYRALLGAIRLKDKVRIELALSDG
jgi:polyisoprenoid-binding protein YceI